MSNKNLSPIAGLLALALLILGCVFYLFCRAINISYKSKEKAAFIQATTRRYHLPSEAAETLHDIAKAHKRIVQNEKYVRSGRDGKLDNGRVKAIHQHDFYMINRWVKRLNKLKAKSPGIMYELESIINEMKEKASEYTLKPHDKARILRLLKQPENKLNRFDDLYICQNL